MWEINKASLTLHRLLRLCPLGVKTMLMFTINKKRNLEKDIFNLTNNKWPYTRLSSNKNTKSNICLKTVGTPQRTKHLILFLENPWLWKTNGLTIFFNYFYKFTILERVCIKGCIFLPKMCSFFFNSYGFLHISLLLIFDNFETRGSWTILPNTVPTTTSWWIPARNLERENAKVSRYLYISRLPIKHKNYDV